MYSTSASRSAGGSSTFFIFTGGHAVVEEVGIGRDRHVWPAGRPQPVSIAGAWITTLAAFAFLGYLGAEALGYLDSP